MPLLLMCKNKAVYNIETNEVLCQELLPGLLSKCVSEQSFRTWLAMRYSSNTNTIARKLKGITFGQEKRNHLNRTTHALSLSDCYWIKESDTDLTFEEINPYDNAFWKGEGAYTGGAIPTLYVGGYLNKEWIDAHTLIKYHAAIEVECSRLCVLCGIPVARVEEYDTDAIAVHNITNTEVMLEQGDQSGNYSEMVDYDESDLIKEFGMAGLRMLVVDAVFANGDRHSGNFGYLRNTDTGEYLGLSPLYDFDHALDSTLTEDRMQLDLVEAIDMIEAPTRLIYIQEGLRICGIVSENTMNPVFQARAEAMIKRLESLN